MTLGFGGELWLHVGAKRCRFRELSVLETSEWE
jgi:hypothetical protein